MDDPSPIYPAHSLINWSSVSRMDEPEQNQSPASINAPSSSSPSISQVQEEEDDQNQDEDNRTSQEQHDQQLLQQQLGSSLLNRVNMSPSEIRDDVWSCLIVLVTFWFFASMTMILGFYGSASLQLGPNCSRLVKVNPIFVQSIKAQRIDATKPGPVLYGFYESPPLDIETTWSETHDPFIPVNFHKEWIYFLNKGSKMDISYEVKSPNALPLTLVIAQGRESLEEWIQDPSYPNTTLSWNIIYGSGKIQQEITKSSTYYIAVGNLNSEKVEVQLKFTIKAFLYNTTQAYYKCFANNHFCSLKLFLLRESAAVLTSPGPEEVTSDDPLYVKISYGPRWVTYVVGSGMMTVLVLLFFRLCSILQPNNIHGTISQGGDMAAERTPLLTRKDEDLSSWGSSYDSNSHDEEDLDEWLTANPLEGMPPIDGENSNNPPRLCVICFDSPRDCFFLPCGHCAACFTCGSRIAEEAGTCPICRRRMKKVRKIFTV